MPLHWVRWPGLRSEAGRPGLGRPGWGRPERQAGLAQADLAQARQRQQGLLFEKAPRSQRGLPTRAAVPREPWRQPEGAAPPVQQAVWAGRRVGRGGPSSPRMPMPSRSRAPAVSPWPGGQVPTKRPRGARWDAPTPLAVRQWGARTAPRSMQGRACAAQEVGWAQAVSLSPARCALPARVSGRAP